MAAQLIRRVQCLDAHNSFVPVVYRFQLTVLLYFTLLVTFGGPGQPPEHACAS